MLEYVGERTEWVCCKILTSLYMLVALVIVYMRYFHIELYSASECYMYRMTGYYCPGCGGTRAVQALVHVELLRSLRCHPAVLPGVVMLIVFWIGMTCEKIVRPNIKRFKLRRIYFYVVLVIVMIQWIVKNVLLYALGWHI